ncbi:hypothetical protein DFA_05210 [Cavenderia fasciculata]|uniref:RRM domain-containing protein n=1 Tax=Cavenderia fasciculata TaxID=261658 RepID=F4PNM7_CACFS|nr:uncharacterized protein DFA_05210 [Cavenderia fasciculata]EGG23080.1 hypothetical protein DFA_05210 [Cavenderia fasciculata]|eukprot:XP_004360931.1 hypothetical protein DFA_05210 [Cavenderia fasciculata]
MANKESTKKSTATTTKATTAAVVATKKVEKTPTTAATTVAAKKNIVDTPVKKQVAAATAADTKKKVVEEKKEKKVVEEKKVPAAVVKTVVATPTPTPAPAVVVPTPQQEKKKIDNKTVTKKTVEKKSNTTTPTTTSTTTTTPSTNETTTTTTTSADAVVAAPTVSIFGTLSAANNDVMNAFSASNEFKEAPVPEKAPVIPKPVELGPHGKPILTEEDKTKRKEQDTKAREEEGKRTIFLSNVELHTNPRELKQFFSKYGKVESARLRSISTESKDSNRKDSYINKKFNEKRETCNAYVVFEKEESAQKVVAECNGIIFKERHLYVDLASHKHEKGSVEETVFIGNVPFESENEEIFTLFDHAFGGVESVRLVRDGQTGQGKGFGYVLFEKKKYAKAAIKAKTIKMNERELRIFPNKQNPKGKNVKKTPAPGAPVKQSGRKPAMKKKPSSK